MERPTNGWCGETVLYDDRLFVRSPVVVRDLNGDGVDDWVFVGGDRASGLGVFVEWGGGLNPAKKWSDIVWPAMGPGCCREMSMATAMSIWWC